MVAPAAEDDERARPASGEGNDLRRRVTLAEAAHRGATLAPEAYVYALPRAWHADWGYRRFGFHGLSVAWSLERAAATDHSLRGFILAGLQAADAARIRGAESGTPSCPARKLRRRRQKAPQVERRAASAGQAAGRPASFSISAIALARSSIRRAPST